MTIQSVCDLPSTFFLAKKVTPSQHALIILRTPDIFSLAFFLMILYIIPIAISSSTTQA